MKKIKCEVCGFEAVNLVSHISRKHMKISEYKEKYGNYPLILYTTEQLKKMGEATKKNVISPYKIEFWIKKGYSQIEAKYEISIRRPYNVNYWINKFGIIDGKKRYYDFLTKGTTLNGFIKTYGEIEGKIKYENYRKNNRKNNPRCIEYWMNKGISFNDAKKKVSNQQSTFSKQKCIEKFGEENGILIWKKRQEKWQNTLKLKSAEETKIINSKKDASSIKYYKEKYGKGWKDKIIDRSWGNDNVAIKCVQTCNNIDELIKFIPQNFSYRQIKQILNSKVLRAIFKIDENNEIQIYKQIFNEYNFKSIKSNSKFGKMIIYDNMLYRSLGEAEIARFLTKNKINFIYEKAYPFQQVTGGFKLLYDFYLPKYDYYIEYAGLFGGDAKYDKRLLKKQKFCLDNDIKVYFSNKVDDIINRIENLINE